MKTFAVTLTGISPLLMHQDNLSFSEVLTAYRKDPANKKQGVAGDDRSPAWSWMGNAYYTQGGNAVWCMPADNLMTTLREGGAKVPTGKGQATFKRATQSGLLVNESDWPVLIDGNPVPWQPFADLYGNTDFAAHEQTAADHGLMLFVKRAKIGQAKHVRVRPRFDRWGLTGSITVLDDMISQDILQTILDNAGSYCGLGDWRPSSPRSPGPFGRFTAQIKEIK